uniref:Uncharacterized protein n=1 Tax=Glossina palpalis gambiensis TaxID=67801 RepID=A0A1B0B8K1_9MUSC
MHQSSDRDSEMWETFFLPLRLFDRRVISTFPPVSCNKRKRSLPGNRLRLGILKACFSTRIVKSGSKQTIVINKCRHHERDYRTNYCEYVPISEGAKAREFNRLTDIQENIIGGEDVDSKIKAYQCVLSSIAERSFRFSSEYRVENLHNLVSPLLQRLQIPMAAMMSSAIPEYLLYSFMHHNIRYATLRNSVQYNSKQWLLLLFYEQKSSSSSLSSSLSSSSSSLYVIILLLYPE